MPNEAAMYLAL
ncbi:hypothetical protein L4F39_17960 [Vibrio paracholerae]|nr:hypothetical protein [Vibrio cholerae]MCO7068430.1 hypothetical protein [Vibrio paracholerae]MCO7068545.1 hypothetical protein [Vibrio paracholerae]